MLVRKLCFKYIGNLGSKKSHFRVFSFTFLNWTVNVLNCLIYFLTFYFFAYENLIMEYFLSHCSYSFWKKIIYFFTYLTKNTFMFNSKWSIIRSVFASKKHSLLGSFISSVLIEDGIPLVFRGRNVIPNSKN